MTGTRLSPILYHERNELERHLRQRARVEDVADTLSVFFANLSRAVSAADPGEAEAADASPTLRLRHREQLDQLQEAVRAGFVGALRAIRRPAAGPPRPGGPPRPAGPPRPGGPGGPERNDEGKVFGILPRFWEPPPAPVPVTRPAPPRLDIDVLLSALEGALASADRVLDAAEPLPPERVRIPWAEDSDWMELCQDLLQARITDDGDLALSHIERLRRWLPERHGIDVIDTYDGSDEHFRVATASDPSVTVPRTLRPALVPRGRPDAVLRGEAILPAGVPTATIQTPPNAVDEETSYEQ